MASLENAQPKFTRHYYWFHIYCCIPAKYKEYESGRFWKQKRREVRANYHPIPSLSLRNTNNAGKVSQLCAFKSTMRSYNVQGEVTRITRLSR